MSTHLLDDLSSAQRERLAFIEFRLWFLGEVTRKDVIARFGVATAAGTRDLALYLELVPENVEYAGKVHRYRSTFKPLFQHQVQRVLSALTSGFGEGERGGDINLIANDIPARLNQPQLSSLAIVTRAIHGNYPLKLTYHSMKTGTRQREIVPLALVDSGLRWHVRAYDRAKQEFRDLVLTRMDKITPFKEHDPKNQVRPHEQLSADVDWQRILDLDLIPHPAHPHPESIVRDYGMVGGKLKVKLRAAIAGYVLRQWQVDCSQNASLGSREVRLRLENLEELLDVKSAELAMGYR